MTCNKISRLLAPILLLLIVGTLLIFSPFNKGLNEGAPQSEPEIRGQVQSVTQENDETQLLEILINDASAAENGKIVTVTNDERMAATVRKFVQGDEVLLAKIKDRDGVDNFYVVDYVRTPAIFWIFAIFVVVVLLVARWQGLGSIAGLFISFVVIFKMILPLILGGFDPIWAAILGALLIIPSTFYLSHGISRKTTIAALSTAFTLAFTGVLAKVFANFAYITGLASEEVNYLQLTTAAKLDFRGLVVAGIIIGILGVLDDITISQASIVQQLKSVKSKIGFGELYGRALKVGKDHIASIVNTLILVYTGASLPLMLLFLDYSQTFSSVVNLESVAQEIISTLVASIGLVLAVPITTFFAALFLGKTVIKDESYICKH